MMHQCGNRKAWWTCLTLGVRVLVVAAVPPEMVDPVVMDGFANYLFTLVIIIVAACASVRDRLNEDTRDR
jgi:hypothetical protein